MAKHKGDDATKAKTATTEPAAAKPMCGIIMPISAIDGLSEQHWVDVKGLLYRAIKAADFEPCLVSDSEEVAVIQDRIVRSLYEYPMIVCDVSALNANVMFELGLRLAFDKPTVVVKDSGTKFAFDTSPIQTITYPRDLRMTIMEAFISKVTDKIMSTHGKATTDKDYSPYLGSFGRIKAQNLTEQSLPPMEYLEKRFNQLESRISQYRSPFAGKQIELNLDDHDAVRRVRSAMVFIHRVRKLTHKLDDANLDPLTDAKYRVFKALLGKLPLSLSDSNLTDNERERIFELVNELEKQTELLSAVPSEQTNA